MTLFKYILGLLLLCFCNSCADKEEIWINGDKSNPSNTAIFKGKELTLKLETITITGLAIEEFTYEIDEQLINKYDKNNTIYILRSKSGRYSILPEYRFNNDSIKLETSIANAHLDTKEELMHELNHKIRTYNMDVDSVEDKYSYFGSAKLMGKVFKLVKN